MSSTVSKQPLYKVRNSRIHGRGVFAARRIRKGTRIMEYVGDRISHAAADARYDDHDPNDNHTFLFIVDKNTVIDAGVGGNEARFINHSCDGNCESVIQKSRVYIEAVRTIQPGEELGYDYEIGREPDDPPDVDEIFACRCGAPKCRGTMLWPAKRPEAKVAAKKTPVAKQSVKPAAEKRADQRAGKSAARRPGGTTASRKTAKPRKR